MDEILKLLGVDKLDESQTSDVKKKITEMVDVKARERANSYLKEEREKLLKEYEDKFESYKTDITGKFSNFVDSVLEEELQIPEKVVKYAKIGESYHDLIEQFKIKLAIDEGVLDEEVKGLLGEAKSEILKLKKQVNELTSGKMELETDARQMASHIYLRRKCEGLTESQRDYMLNLLGDITEKSEIDRKFEYALKMSEAIESGVEVPEGEAASNACICPQCGAIASSQTECSATPCGACGGMMKDVEDDIAVPADEMGQGAMEVETTIPDPEAGRVQEDTSPFGELKGKWLKILKENKF